MMATIPRNVFPAAPEHYWLVRFFIPERASELVETTFGDAALSISTFEVDEESSRWKAEILLENEMGEEEANRRLSVMADLADCTLPAYEQVKLEARDWVSEVQASFPPLHIGRFFVHGSHYEGVPPQHSLPIRIDAGMAFGSGEHATTSTCLLALTEIEEHPSGTVLDMGCGSGILAIGAAKLWKRPVIAVDIDENAVRVTEENAQLNHEATHIHTAVSDGYQSELVKKHAPYQLIVSNILARPLINFAPDLAKNLAEGGTAILSGLLARQEEEVLRAHTDQGLRLIKTYAEGEWRTLVLRR